MRDDKFVSIVKIMDLFIFVQSTLLEDFAQNTQPLLKRKKRNTKV